MVPALAGSSETKSAACTTRSPGTLTMSFLGSPPGYTSYSGARVLESGNAVALIPHRTELVTGTRTAVGMMRQVIANLDRPLGNRVLLDDTGSPVMATSV